MSNRFRIPITAITVFGTSGLLALTVGIVLFLGFSQAATSTRQLWADQAETLIDAMEEGLDARLKPVRDQALWVSKDIRDLSNPAALDRYILGSLAATPQVAGVAVIAENGKIRRWDRKNKRATDEDWTHYPWIEEYLGRVAASDGPAWREPIFTDTVGASTLLHDVPLHDPSGEFIGVFAQIVPVQEFSSFLVREYADTGITPFVLYNRDFVLAHPSLGDGNQQNPLPTLEEFGELVLQQIWSPDEDVAYIQQSLTNTRASGTFWGDDFYLFLYRDLTGYGEAPWTIGAYLNTSLLEERPGQRIMRALAAGLIVMLLAIIASIFVGRKVSSPVKAIVRAAGAVNAGKLDDIDDLHGSRIRELDDAGFAFNKMVHGLRERKLIRDTLGRFVPEKVAGSLLAGNGELEVQQTEATILFCDIEAFTRLTEALGPVKIVEVLNAYFSDMVDILERHGGVVTQFQGDAILATFNVPVADDKHAANAIAAALEMLDEVASTRYAGEKIDIRIGINTGSVVAGAIGARGRLNYTVHGDAVNLAARLENLNKQYGSHLLVAESSARQASDSGLVEIGEVTVRGQSRSIKLFGLGNSIGIQ